MSLWRYKSISNTVVLKRFHFISLYYEEIFLWTDWILEYPFYSCSYARHIIIHIITLIIYIMCVIHYILSFPTWHLLHIVYLGCPPLFGVALADYKSDIYWVFPLLIFYLYCLSSTELYSTCRCTRNILSYCRHVHTYIPISPHLCFPISIHLRHKSNLSIAGDVPYHICDGDYRIRPIGFFIYEILIWPL